MSNSPYSRTSGYQTSCFINESYFISFRETLGLNGLISQWHDWSSPVIGSRSLSVPTSSLFLSKESPIGEQSEECVQTKVMPDWHSCVAAEGQQLQSHTHTHACTQARTHTHGIHTCIVEHLRNSIMPGKKEPVFVETKGWLLRWCYAGRTARAELRSFTSVLSCSYTNRVLDMTKCKSILLLLLEANKSMKWISAVVRHSSKGPRPNKVLLWNT